jgi:hypothetical protein
MFCCEDGYSNLLYPSSQQNIKGEENRTKYVGVFYPEDVVKQVPPKY